MRLARLGLNFLEERDAMWGQGDESSPEIRLYDTPRAQPAVIQFRENARKTGRLQESRAGEGQDLHIAAAPKRLQDPPLLPRESMRP